MNRMRTTNKAIAQPAMALFFVEIVPELSPDESVQRESM
jgi:hypothetical protein